MSGKTKEERNNYNSKLPSGYLGKNFKDMTKDEVLEAFSELWERYHETKRELQCYESDITNTKPIPPPVITIRESRLDNT